MSSLDYMKVKKLLDSVSATLPPLIIAFFTFELVVGFERLIPTNISWLTRTGWSDGWGAYLGWETYRYSPLTIPLGLNKAYGMDIGNSIVYTDSIPLLAIPFRLFSFLLPTPFQYFGLWLLICFCLQAIMSWKIFSRYTGNKLVLSCVTLIFIFSPILLKRLNVHMSQVGHFLFLWALYLIIQSRAKQTLHWFILLSISALVHSYFFVLNFLIFVANEMYLRNIAKQSSYRSSLNIVLCALFSIPTLWLSGYFVSLDGATNPFHNDLFKMDLIQPLNFTGWSLIFASQFPSQQGNFEGFNYLGPGTIILSFVFLLMVIFSRQFRDSQKIINKALLPIILVLILLTLYSLTYKITFARNEILEIPIPMELKSALTSFRASGRFFAPVFYFITFFVLKSVISLPSKKIASYLLILAASLQVLDTRMGWASIKSINTPHSTLAIGQINMRSWSLVLTDKTNILTVPSGVPSELCQQWRLVGYLAYKFELSTNCFYFARSSAQRKLSNRATIIRLLERGDPTGRSVIVLGHREYHEFFRSRLHNSWDIAKINELFVLKRANR